jgi:hypothetical protein
MLFQAQLNGDLAVNSIITQLKKIEKVKHHFDAVAIIRGGGGEIGLSCYNNYELAKEIALFPLTCFNRNRTLHKYYSCGNDFVSKFYNTNGFS